MLFGVAVLNSLVLVSYISQLRAEGASVADAVLRGCETRLRAVLMTASLAIFSLIPMVVATGPGSEVQRPLAVVVIGGLLTSAALTLFVLPVLSSEVEERRGRPPRSCSVTAARSMRAHPSSVRRETPSHSGRQCPRRIRDWPLAPRDHCGIPHGGQLCDMTPVLGRYSRRSHLAGNGRLCATG